MQLNLTNLIEIFMPRISLFLNILENTQMFDFLLTSPAHIFPLSTLKSNFPSIIIFHNFKHSADLLHIGRKKGLSKSVKISAFLNEFAFVQILFLIPHGTPKIC